jgi:hypothetical protein
MPVLVPPLGGGFAGAIRIGRTAGRVRRDAVRGDAPS